MRKLEKKLEENKIKEEKEAQDLEAMVQHVEQNLQLMTVNVGFRFRSDVRKKFPLSAWGISADLRKEQ